MIVFSIAFYKNIYILILWFASDRSIYFEKNYNKRVFVFCYEDFFFLENKF